VTTPSPERRDIDARCTHRTCVGMVGAYRMVGACRNCGTEGIVILLTRGHEAKRTTGWGGYACPVCGCREVRASRLATEDEVPVL
jgi:hypothetical protein